MRRAFEHLSRLTRTTPGTLPDDLGCAFALTMLALLAFGLMRLA